MSGTKESSTSYFVTVKRTEGDVSRLFSKLVLVGAVLKFLDKNVDSGVLESNEGVINELKDLHPTPVESLPNILLQCPIKEISPANFYFVSTTKIY